MKARNPQLPLRLGAPLPDEAAWGDGERLPYLGEEITLHLGTDRSTASLEAHTLHLPLPPEASPRQIRDAAEVWLQRQAEAHFARVMLDHTTRLGLTPPRLALSFASKGGWVMVEGDCLRCNWRLMAQKPEVIDQLIARALGQLPRPAAEGDLFSLI